MKPNQCGGLAAFAAVWVVASLGYAAGEESERQDFKIAALRAGESVVLVVGRQGGAFSAAGQGTVANTGFIVDTEGHVLTSIVSVTGVSGIEVRCTDGKSSAASVVAIDQHSGLALLKTELKDTVPVELSEEPTEVGEWVLVPRAVMRPGGGVDVLLDAGMLSRRDACIKLSGYRWDSLLRAEIRSMQECAAAPMLGADGKAVGVVVAMSGGEGRLASCYGVPAGELKPILANLLAGNSRRLGWLGIAIASSPEMDGLSVRGVLAGSPGYEAGLRPGDVLLEIAGETISEPSTFESKIASLSPGDAVALGVLRGGNLKTVMVTLGARPLLIARIPARQPSGLFDGRRDQVAVAASSAISGCAAHGEMIEMLRRENSELRQRILRIEQRLGEDKGDGGGQER